MAGRIGGEDARLQGASAVVSRRPVVNMFAAYSHVRLRVATTTTDGRRVTTDDRPGLSSSRHSP